MIRSLALLLAAGSLAWAQDAPATPPAPTRLGELERLGEGGRELMILGIDAPGFQNLRPTQRKLAYYLYRAALAGHDIAYLQSHRHAWDIKELFETLYQHRDLLDPAVAEAATEYLKLVWANHGQYRHYQHTKFTPRNLTFAQLDKALKTLKKKKVSVEFRKGVTLATLKPHIFDPKVEPIQVNQVSGADPVKTSASGLYDPGLTLKAIEALPKEVQSQLNVRFAKKGTKAIPETFKVGGMYGQQLSNVVYWLKKAVMYVDQELTEVEKDGVKKPRYVPSPVQKKALDDLIAYLEGGDETRFKEHSVAWLKTRSAVDYLNGFYEIYKDPRGVIGAYQANVSFRTDAELVDKLTQNAAYFEAKMPWKDAWKRAKVEPPVALVVNLLMATGDGGPIPPAAYNLPNYNDIRRDHGSKNVMLMNVETAASPTIKAQTLRTFYRPEDQPLMEKHGDLGRLWLVYLHEIIGHGSGQPDASLQGEDPGKKLGPIYSTLEECRADAVALYQFLDPKIVEMGVVNPAEHATAAKAMFLSTLTRALRAQGELDGQLIREAHDRGETAILNFLSEPGQDRGIAVVNDGGKHFITVTDLEKARVGVSSLLSTLQTFKSMGDQAGAIAFFERYGTQANPVWQADVKARLATINRPKEQAFVFPQLMPVVEEKNGREMLKDVVLETKETFAEQMLRIKAWGKSRELLPK